MICFSGGATLVNGQSLSLQVCRLLVALARIGFHREIFELALPFVGLLWFSLFLDALLRLASFALARVLLDLGVVRVGRHAVLTVTAKSVGLASY